MEYGIVVHCEATCSFRQPSPKLRKSEIIEFTAVLLNFKTGIIETEFQQFVKPTEIPQLSEFCINLTGIKQNNVDNGVILETTLKNFDEWLRTELTKRNVHLPEVYNSSKDVALVSWCDWDIGVCLTNECRRKNLQKEKYFDQWIDLRLSYENAYYSKYPNSYPREHIKFVNALKYYGLDFLGSKFSGMDDARNLAALAWKIKSSGATLVMTK